MNRQARRAAERSKAKPDAKAPLTTPDVTQWFDEALAHQQAGRAAEAARLYDRILAANPGHIESLQNLGLIALMAGRNDLAVNQFARAIAINAALPDQHYYMATALHGLGRIAEAAVHGRHALQLNADHHEARQLLGELLQLQGQTDEARACFERVLAADPDHAAAHAHLALALTHKGRFAEAGDHYQRALALDPDNARTHFNYGAFHHDRGELEPAIACYLRAMELDPNHLDTHYNFCAALMGQSQFDSAADYYEQFLALKPDFIAGYSHLALAYNGAGKTQAALDAVQRGLAKQETAFGKSVFVQCLRNLPSTPDPALKALVVRAVSEPWTRPNELTRHCIALIKADPDIGPCVARAAAAFPAALGADELFGRNGLAALSRDPLVRAFLENSRVSTLDMEQFLIAVRATLLDTALAATMDTAPTDDTLAFYCAMARQFFIVEYAFLQSDAELARAETLRGSVIAALQSGAPVPPVQLAAIAAFMPLHRLDRDQNLLARPWPAPVDALLTQQIREPAEERRLRGTITALTPIEDTVSVAVRDQYEEHPYPRWVEAPTLEQPVSVDKHIRGLFPLADYRHIDTGGGIDLLIAGCGTGQSVVNYGRRFVKARVLAVDLSLTSLSYAKRKIQKLGLNVEFAQADILKLGTLKRRFNVINCSGVLHHLGDPMQGWRLLLSLLAPNGVMSVALYSEAARVDYVAAQKLIVQLGYGSTSDEIRRFRRDLIASEPSQMRTGVLGCGDFFTISACRDLLFHAQEHRMTIPQIKAFIEENGLTFLGFELDQPQRLHYSACFPDDRALTNLDNWHAYEQQHPYAFLRMYQFWVQAAPAATG